MVVGGHRVAGGGRVRCALQRALIVAAAATMLAAAAPASSLGAPSGQGNDRGQGNRFDVGTSVVDITPTAPQYVGGYDVLGPPTADAHDPLQVRAFFVGRGSHAVTFVVVDSQGWFAGYQEGPFGVTDARRDAANELRSSGYDVGAANVIVSSSHSHAAPTIMGIWGPTDPAYLKRVHDAAVQAVEQASASARPAALWSGSGSIRSLIEQNVQGTDHLDGWKVDDTLPVLWARKPGSGATLAIYANVPVHPDQFRGVKYGLLSADYPGNVRDRLHAALGGTAVIGEATLGRQETIGSIDDYSEVERQGTFITNAIERALAGARPVHGHKIGAREQLFQTTVTNSDLILLVRLNALIGFFCVPDMTNPDICSIDRSVDAPYLNSDGSKLGTWVATARIGNLVYTTEPGEAFPEVAAAIRRSIHGARAVNVVGMSEDQLGYFFPSDTYSDAQMATSDFQRFNVGPELPDQTVAAAASNARALGFAARSETVTAEAFDPDAFHKAGVQFYPEIVESGRATVSFLATARASQDGTPGRTVSPIDWEFGDGTGGPSPNGDGQWFDHSFPGPGTYHVTATVTDQDGAPRSWTQTVIVDPPLKATVRAHPRGSDVVLSAGAKGGDGRLLAAHWSFPDGSTADGLTVTQPRGGESGDIEVEVVDGAGNQASLVFRLHQGALVALQHRAG